MQPHSGYTFPIFISSTHYNLIDLRAELYRYLQELGYNPYLSSAEGFPDKTPELEPWESCLPVLDNCFVIVLIIDGKYGEELSWPHFHNILNDRQISPTHAEYIFAHKRNKRLIVFIRKNLVTHYQSYKTALKETESIEEADEIMKKVLPGGVDIRTLKFFQEVKTSKPIPWIVEFEDVTEIKPEIQRKLLNELSEAFMKKDLRLLELGTMLDDVADEIPTEKSNDVLLKINSKKSRSKEQLAKGDIPNPLDPKTMAAGAETDEITDKGSIHEREVLRGGDNAEASVSPSGLLIDQNGKLRFNPSSVLITSGSDFLFNPLVQPHVAICEKCGKTVSLFNNFRRSDWGFKEINTCKTCGRILCNDCFSLVDYYGPYQSCSDCSLTMVLPEQH